MRNCALIVAAYLALAMSATPAMQAAQVVWSGLVMAENVAQPSRAPEELTRIEETLKELFGYNQFQVIGQSRKTLKTGEEDWLAASKYFALHVDAQGEHDAGYVLNLKLYKEKELLLEWDTKLSKQSPLVIKGPQVGNGQLLLVLVIEDNHSSESERTQRRADYPPNKLLAAWRYLSRKIRDSVP